MSARELRLEVVLKAVDKLTGPLRRMKTGSTDLARTVKATRDHLAELNRTHASIDSFRKLSRDAAIAGNQLRTTQARVKALAQEMRSAGTPSAELKRQFAAASKEAAALKQRGLALKQSLQGVRERLQAAGISTGRLADAQRDLRGRISTATHALAEQDARLKVHYQRLKALRAAEAQYQQGMSRRNAMLGTGVTTMAAGGATLAPVVKSVKDYVTFEDAMLGIARQVEGARDESGKLTAVYHDMAREIRQLGRELPIPTAAIAEMVTAGARMEVPREELIAYTRTVAMMATAFDAVPDEIAEQMGKVAKNFRIPTAGIRALADTINYLDDNAISKGGDIIDVLNRVSGVISTVKMSDKDAAALASTLLTLGERTETAGTAINAITQKFAAADKGTKKFREAVAEIGLTTQEIQQGMATDATATIFKVIEAVRSMPEDKRVGVMVELVGLQHSDTLAKLVDKPEEFRRQLELANGDKAQGSMGREFAARQDTISARWQRLQNQVFNTSSAGGEALRSTLVGLMDTLGRLLDRFDAFAKANPELVAGLIKGVAVVGAIITAFGALTLALAAMLGPLVIMRFGFAILGVKLGGSVGMLTRMAGGFNLLMKVFKGVGAGVLGVGKAFAWVGRLMLTNPIGIAVLALAGLVYLIYRYWEPIKGYFTGLWSEVRAAFGAGLTGVLTLLANWSLYAVLYRAVAPLLRYLGIDLPATFSEFGVQLMAGLARGIERSFALPEGAITRLAGRAVKWFKETLGIHSPSRVFAQLGMYTMAGLEQGLQRGQEGPLGVISNVSRLLAGAGAVSAARVPIDARPPLASRPTAAQPAAAAPVVIHIHPPAGTNEREIARLVEEKLRRLDAQQQARRRSRLTDLD